MSPTDFGFAKLISMYDESIFANFAVFNVQPRFNVVIPRSKILAVNQHIIYGKTPQLGTMQKTNQTVGKYARSFVSQEQPPGITGGVIGI